MKPFDWDSFEWDDSSRVVILTGAGISAESGIKTFRDSNGLWENHSIEEVATPEAFAKNPKLVTDFYNQRRLNLFDVTPNDAHVTLVNLEKILGERFFLVTQNVDDLHERAGSQRLIHMHGELLSLKCTRNAMHKRRIADKNGATQPYAEPCSQCSGIMRPDIVWFGELPYQMDMIYNKIFGATHFIYIGTSSQVYPAAGFKEFAKQNGAKILCLDLKVNFGDINTDFYLEGKATSTLQTLYDFFKN